MGVLVNTDPNDLLLEDFDVPLLDGCVNDDSTEDEDGDTCTDWYDEYPDGCGDYDDEDFYAATQCCACKRFSGTTYAPTPRRHEKRVRRASVELFDEYRLRYEPKPKTVGLLKQQKMLDATSTADWESAIHDAVEEDATGRRRDIDADDDTTSTPPGRELRPQLQPEAARRRRGHVHDPQVGGRRLKDNAAPLHLAQTRPRVGRTCTSSARGTPRASTPPTLARRGVRLEQPSPRPTVAAPTRVPTSKPTETPSATPSPRTSRPASRRACRRRSPPRRRPSARRCS